MTKAELRKVYLGLQRSLGAGERAQKSAQIADRIFATFDLSTIRVLHCFIPIEKFNELNTLPLLRRVWREFPHITTVVPRIDAGSSMMASVAVTDATAMIVNPWGVNEPASGKAFAADAIDIVIVPGVAFDNALHRVGYGKGFYDRFLADCRDDCVKVGVSFFEPVDAITDIDAHDVRLDRLVTPDAIYSA